MKTIAHEYDKVSSDGTCSTYADDEEETSNLMPTHEKALQRNHMKRLTIANVCLFVVSVVFLSATHIRSTPTTAQFVERFSSYSPARVAVKYVSGTFNASQGEETGYVGTSDETNEMWDWVTSSIGDQMITLEELKLVEKPETSVKVTDPRTGKEGYRIGIEVFHQLHCLNLIRQSTYPEVYGGKGDFAPKFKDKIRGHLDHCLEMIRMNIMCEVNIGVITFHDRPGKPGDPWPDFSTNHVCRDFDAVRDWAIENTVANDDIF
ncbi:uncharacterized protein RSE6_15001 [Rhynchosporium secalis]|uniref:Tat pathway signal sequence n=1 Tax=Rhynchosporium secalis TaxID=38038 RepID=A0A1E1MWI7_RHYSE|nr:uncharacterized protein RSE6_15001 [Rhynchosporium secalis]